MMASPELKGLVPFSKKSLELIKQHIAKKHNKENEGDDLKPNPDLEVGKELPLIYGSLSGAMVSEPLEDVDPYYYLSKKTFMVLNKNRTIFRFNAASIFCTLSPFSTIRGTTIKVLIHPYPFLLAGLKSVVGIMIHCLKKLAGAIILTILFLSIFSLTGMGLFMGNLKHKCLWWPQGNENETLYNRTGSPYYIQETENFYYLEGEVDALLCGNRTDASQCPEGYVCVKAGKNPDHGSSNFDNFGWAFLALFRLMTQDYPEALYHQILYSSGKIYMIFFVVVTFWFTFYIASLFLGIISMAYEEEKHTTSKKTEIDPKFQQTIKALQERNEAAEV
ncbi:Sodium channel protein type 7 subunit alpha [Fukomys damarensis]|uniref:Sodium channel protein type 7 subunit alpha n=1 Tax=Fukomys damarensis TaxID=885580 RepID=A0A091CV91_FUKDA|nr:Sodium channel protein type 7 subunit alpha [Fukomys damarensis]